MTTEQVPNRDPEARLRRWLEWTLAICGLALLAGAVSAVIGPGPFEVLDDSYMFVRYADNLLHFGRMSWNPGGEPVYGATSQLAVFWTALARVFVPHNAALAAAISSFTAGLLFLTLAAVLVAAHVGAGRTARAAIMIVLSVVLFYNLEALRAHFSTGMDTALAMAFLAGYLIAARRHEQSGSGGTLIALGWIGGLAYMARPDLVLFSLLVPAAMIVAPRGAAGRSHGFILLGMTVAIAGAQASFAAAYYHTPVPLSFYIKTWRGYEDFNFARYQGVARNLLMGFIQSYRVLVALIAADVLSDPRGWWLRSTPVDKGTAAACVVFAAYYATGVLPIMPHHQRFYYPMLPAVLYLAARSMLALRARLPWSASGLDDRSSRSAGMAAMAGVLALLAFASQTGLGDVASALRHRHFGQWDVRSEYRAHYADYWVALERVALLPHDLVVASTEVGRLAALNPDKTIVDLAGLNETSIGLHGFAAGPMLRRYRPDLIYMPHPDYRGMIRDLLSDSLFRARYENFTPDSLGATMGIALRRDAPYYAELRRIVDDRLTEHRAHGGPGR